MRLLFRRDQKLISAQRKANFNFKPKNKTCKILVGTYHYCLIMDLRSNCLRIKEKEPFVPPVELIFQQNLSIKNTNLTHPSIFDRCAAFWFITRLLLYGCVMKWFLLKWFILINHTTGCPCVWTWHWFWSHFLWWDCYFQSHSLSLDLFGRLKKIKKRLCQIAIYWY